MIDSGRMREQDNSLLASLLFYPHRRRIHCHITHVSRRILQYFRCLSSSNDKVMMHMSGKIIACRGGILGWDIIAPRSDVILR